MKKENFITMISALLLAIASLSGCEKTNNIIPDITPVTDTIPVLIGQGVLYGNGQEGIIKQNLVIKTQTEWNNLLTAMNSVNNVSDSFTETDIDFSEYMVIAVFDEVKSNGGWSIDITDVTNYADSIVVTVQNLKQGDDTDITIQPYCIVRIPLSEKNVIFRQESSSDINYPIEIPFTEYSLGDSCQWTYLNYPAKGAAIIINSSEELTNYIYCEGGSYSDIPFSEYTLLVVSATSPSSVPYVLDVDFFKESTNEYTLNLRVFSGIMEFTSRWQFAILTPKISNEIIITLNVTYI